VLDIVGDPVSLSARPLAPRPPEKAGWGRDLFTSFRAGVGVAETGGSIFHKGHS
jgi:hypothetical protein